MNNDTTMWKLVPVEPTDEMIEAAQQKTPEFAHGDPWYGYEKLSERQVTECYAAMLASSPASAVQEPVAWEYRFWWDGGGGEPFGWGRWERIEARSALSSVADFVQEVRDCIARGHKYELRALYAAPFVQQGGISCPQCGTRDECAKRGCADAAMGHEFKNELGIPIKITIEGSEEEAFTRWHKESITDSPWDAWQARAALSAPAAPGEREALSDEQIEQEARDTFDPDGRLDWSMPENLGASAVHRAYFRMGFRCAIALSHPQPASPDLSRPVSEEEVAQWVKVFDSLVVIVGPKDAIRRALEGFLRGRMGSAE